MTNYNPLTKTQFSEICKFLETTIPPDDETPKGVSEFGSEIIINFAKNNLQRPDLMPKKVIIELHTSLMAMFYLGKVFGNEELRQKIEEIMLGQSLR